MATDGPTFEVFGDLSDEAIEALAALLLSIADNMEQTTPDDSTTKTESPS